MPRILRQIGTAGQEDVVTMAYGHHSGHRITLAWEHGTVTLGFPEEYIRENLHILQERPGAQAFGSRLRCMYLVGDVAERWVILEMIYSPEGEGEIVGTLYEEGEFQDWKTKPATPPSAIART